MESRIDKNLRELGYTPAKTKETQPETPSIVQGRDLFQTPRYAVDLLKMYIPNQIRKIWECASGEGRIYKRLEEDFYVYGTDIRPAGEFVDRELNFLTDNPPFALDERWAIITNPPFSLKSKFYYRCLDIGIPFALLIPADYSGWIIRACTSDGAEKLIPTRRIDYITPNTLLRVNSGEGTSYSSIDDIPQDLLYRYSSSDFHSMWLTRGFDFGRTETFVELTLKEKKENI